MPHRRTAIVVPAPAAEFAHVIGAAESLCERRSGVAYGAQLAYSHSQQPNHTSSYLVVYANDDGNPQPASIGFLVYGGIPAPPPPPPPACITSYTKAACDSCAEACSWCASADGVHALCFDETDKPATGWSCD